MSSFPFLTEKPLHPGSALCFCLALSWIFFLSFPATFYWPAHIRFKIHPTAHRIIRWRGITPLHHLASVTFLRANPIFQSTESCPFSVIFCGAFASAPPCQECSFSLHYFYIIQALAQNPSSPQKWPQFPKLKTISSFCCSALVHYLHFSRDT